jgi:hypothetical protein
MPYSLLITIDSQNPACSLPRAERLLRSIGQLEMRLSNAFYVSTRMPATIVYAALRGILEVDDHLIVAEAQRACSS